MKVYRVADWDKTYENHRTREMPFMGWVPISNRLDGDAYTLLVDDEIGAALFGAWVALLLVASKCEPRGILLRHSAAAHDAASLARLTRMPAEIIEQMLRICSEECKLLEIITLQEVASLPKVVAEERTTPRPLRRKIRPESWPTQAEWMAYTAKIGLPAWKAAREWRNQEHQRWPRVRDWQAHARYICLLWENDGRPEEPFQRGGSAFGAGGVKPPNVWELKTKIEALTGVLTAHPGNPKSSYSGEPSIAERSDFAKATRRLAELQNELGMLK